MIILGIETSCDETSASVVKDGCELLSVVTASSMDLHVAYGGVVPEIAARSHIESIIPVIEKALEQAFSSQKSKVKKSKVGTQDLRPSTFDPWTFIDAIVVTYGAGLGGSLLVGVMTARTLAIVKNKPLYAVNHVHGHVAANFLTQTSLPHYQLPATSPEFPMLALIVSGGHTQLVFFKNIFDYTVLGKTRDDAIGEAFDKVAKILGLPYPGGPSVSKIAENGDPFKYKFPKAKLDQPYEFSFSGIKTAVLRQAQEEIGEDFTFPSKNVPERLSEANKADFAASFQRVAVETVVDKTIVAYEEFQPKSIVIAGGVSANAELRRQLQERLAKSHESRVMSQDNKQISDNGKMINDKSMENGKWKMENCLLFTDSKLCTDNGAMIATLGCFMAMNNLPTADPYALDIQPSLKM